MQIELQAGGATLLSGPWDFSCVVAGQKLLPVDNWDEVCWHSDEDVDYLELEIHLENGWQLQRSLMLAREDGFLFIADALLSETPAEYQYTSHLPVASSCTFAAGEETHEGFLKTADSAALVMPLSLPEWRDGPRNGELKQNGQRLTLSQHSTAARAFTPLLIDFEATAESAYTWRQLTVASNLQIVSNDVAVGYRARRNAKQWAFYRSLAAPANRTVLGENIICEFFALRLADDGSTHEIVSVG